MTSPVDEGRLLPRHAAVPLPRADPEPRPAPPTAKRPGKRRLYVLDGLRLVAALMVMAYHYMAYNRVHYWGKSTAAVFPTGNKFAIYGWLGVYLFFLISGFVICLSCWGRTPRQFAVSRFIRLYPAYWVGLILTSAVLYFRPGGTKLELTDVLTNATMLQDPQVRQDLQEADKVFCKLDASDDRMLQLIDRPVEGVTLDGIVSGIKALRAEYKGYLAIQSMFMPQNLKDVETYAAILKEIQPDEVQLNTPLRPVPKGWYIEARGNHDRESAPYEAYELKHLDRDQAQDLEARLRELTGLKIVSVYKQEA